MSQGLWFMVYGLGFRVQGVLTSPARASIPKNKEISRPPPPYAYSLYKGRVGRRARNLL